jgi:hypothetical protein
MTCPHCHMPLSVAPADPDLGGAGATGCYQPCACEGAVREASIRLRLTNRTSDVFVSHTPADLEWLLARLDASRAECAEQKRTIKHLWTVAENGAAYMVELGQERDEARAEVAHLRAVVACLMPGDAGRIP